MLAGSRASMTFVTVTMTVFCAVLVVWKLWRLLSCGRRTYDLAELGLEVVDADVVLDVLELCYQRHLRLHEGRELLLGDCG